MQMRLPLFVILVAFLNLLTIPVNQLVSAKPYATKEMQVVKESSGTISCILLIVMAEETNEEEQEHLTDEDTVQYLRSDFAFNPGLKNKRLLYLQPASNVLCHIETVFGPPDDCV